jgi:hypothetical protein
MSEVYFFDYSGDGFLEGCSHIIFTEGVWADHHEDEEFRECEKELNK